MKKSIRKIALLLTGAMLITALAACSSLDVVGKDSVTSFGKVLTAIPDKVTADEMNVGWALSAPDDSVRFIWSEDYSKAPLHDVMLELDAQPFLDAGLEPDKLPDNYAFYEGDIMGGMGSQMLMVGAKLGNSDKVSGTPTALSAYELIVNKYRNSIGYHTALDHYNVNLGDGNLFEWAKDFATNGTTKENQDKDIVFVLNPEPLIAADVDPEKVEGWVYTTVSVDIDGKPTDVYKFLKPFDLQ
jgi:hypothetical protein